MSIEDADKYLEQLSTEDPELYTQVKKYFLSFEDLLEMPEHIMRVFWRNPEIDIDDLSKALKAYDEEMANKIISYMSKRNQSKFSAYEQPLSKRDIDTVQSSFVSLARKMHDDGEINLTDVLEATDMVE